MLQNISNSDIHKGAPDGAELNGAKFICDTIDAIDADLRDINKKIYGNPELALNEFQAHDNIVALLRKHGHAVTEHTFGLETSFQAEYGSGGRVVTFNAEYDALPGIGHACGHNLIATAGIAAFLSVAATLKASGRPGRVRLLGTPAEESLGGKIMLVKAGAYDDVDACLMLHPSGPDRHYGKEGTSYCKSLASDKIRIRYYGCSAHASLYPFEGVNALDASALAYSAVSMLRQQIRPYERIHGIVEKGGVASNVIPEMTQLNYGIRSRTVKELKELKKRVLRCFEGAAVATGCRWEVEEVAQYADLRPNRTICSMWAQAMEEQGSPVNSEAPPGAGLGSTDMGNVCYVCPGFHGYFGIPVDEGVFTHNASFTKFGGLPIAHEKTIVAAKGIAQAGWRILESEEVAKAVWADFDNDEDTARRTAEEKAASST